MRVGEIEMGRRSREEGKTHDVYRVWGWWVLPVLLGTFLKEIPPIPRIYVLYKLFNWYLFKYFINFFNKKHRERGKNGL